VLEANGNRATWRDVQHMLVNGARKVDTANGGWIVNGAGWPVSLKYGFGIFDADKTVNVAKTWLNVGPQITATFGPYTCVSCKFKLITC
jgi:hypothetical protein